MPRVGRRHRPLVNCIASVVVRRGDYVVDVVAVVSVEGGGCRGFRTSVVVGRQLESSSRRGWGLSWRDDAGKGPGHRYRVSRVRGREGGVRSLEGACKVNWQEEESTEPSQNTTTPSP